MSSTDDLPNQNRCPTGLGSWCRYNGRCYERQDYMNLLGVTPHTITEQQMLEVAHTFKIQAQINTYF